MIKLLCCVGALMCTPFLLSAACDGATQPGAEHRATIQKWVELWGRYDAKLADEILAPNVVRFHPRDEQIRDREGLKQLVQHIRTAFPDFAVKVRGIEIDERGGRLSWTVSGTHTGPGEGPATGKAVSISGSDVFVIVDGQITQNWGSWDQNEFFAQLGAPRVLPRAHRNLTTLLRWPNDLMNRGQYELLDELFTSDHVLEENGVRYEGVAGMRRYVKSVLEAFEGFHLQISDAHCDGERGSARWLATGKHTGEFFGIQATGRNVQVSGLMLSLFEGGKLKRSFLSWDTAALLRQLGVTGDMGSPANASATGK